LTETVNTAIGSSECFFCIYDKFFSALKPNIHSSWAAIVLELNDHPYINWLLIDNNGRSKG